MAGGIHLSARVGDGDKLKTSLSGSFHYQMMKLIHGAAGTFDFVSAAAPLPVTGLISITGSLVVTNGGTFAVQEDGAALTALELIDDTVAVFGTATYTEATTKGMIVGAVRNDTLAALADTDNEIAPLQVNDIGALFTKEAPSVIDANNTTTSTLTSGSTFTGTGTDMLAFEGVTVMLDASHDSATDGMLFEWSTDNSNWDVTKTFTYTAADGGRTFQFGVQAQYFRVRYTNGGTNQTHFRVQTICHRSEIATTIHRLVDDTNPDRSAALVKSAIIAQAAGSGDFKAVQSTAGGNLKVAIEEIDAPISLTGSMSVMAQGVAAHDAAVSGNPVLNGAEARTTNPTAVADGDTVRLQADDLGRQVVAPHAPRDLVTDNHVSLSLSTTLTLLPAGGAGVLRDLLSLTISNPSSSAATVTIFDGLAGGTQRFKWEFAANGGGLTHSFPVPFKQASANNGWGITSSELGVTATAQAVDTV